DRRPSIGCSGVLTRKIARFRIYPFVFESAPASLVLVSALALKVAFSCWPAYRAARLDPVSSLKHGFGVAKGVAIRFERLALRWLQRSCLARRRDNRGDSQRRRIRFNQIIWWREDALRYRRRSQLQRCSRRARARPGRDCAGPQSAPDRPIDSRSAASGCSERVWRSLSDA